MAASSNQQEKLPGQEEEAKGAMAFGAHLDELRGRLIKSLMAIAVIFCIAIVFSNNLILFLTGPLRQAMPNLAPGQKPLHFTGAMDVLMAQFKISILFSLVVSCPVWIYQLWRFVEPALFPKEKRYLKPFVVGSVFLFFLGIGFCYSVVLPMSLSFLIGVGTEIGNPIITVDDYISMLSVLMLGFGAIFETPVVLVLLSMLGLFDSKILAAGRQYAAVGILIIAAILTPPDPVSQIVMAAPMYIMYEASIYILKMIERKRSEAGVQRQA